MRILVTGGAGFIGSNFVRFLVREHPAYQITNLDKLTYAGNLENLEGVNQRFVRGDICDAPLLAGLLAEHDAVVNFAAESHVDRSILDSASFFETNVRGTYVLLEAARRTPVSRFLHVSTDEVYGSMAPGQFATEDSPLRPSSPYAASKAAAEMLAMSYAHTYRMPLLITRASNNYGPFQFPEKFMPLALINALNDEPIPVYGDGRNVRDWIFVEDHCRAIQLTLEKGKAGGVYNIGARNERRNLEVAESILDALGKPHSLIKFVKDRPGHDRRYAIDPTVAETELGWRPIETWKSGLEKTIRWYGDNSTWIERARSGAYRDYYKRQYGAEIKP